jgi:hypothetical protein
LWLEATKFAAAGGTTYECASISGEKWAFFVYDGMFLIMNTEVLWSGGQ